MLARLTSVGTLWVTLAAALGLGGCALNLVEARPAKTLPDGDWQVTYAQTLVAPTRVVTDVIGPSRDLVKAAKDGDDLNAEEKQQLIGAALAISLSGPGFGTHIDVARGLPYGFEVGGRLGNGIYALGARKGFSLGDDWETALGVRAAYNSGASPVPYFDDINGFVEVSALKRYDVSGTFLMGKEWADIFRIWFGAKAMQSFISGKIDATAIDLGEEDLSGETMLYYGGLFGMGLGYKWVHLFAELSVMRADGGVEIFGEEHDLSGMVFTPAWGVQVTF